MTLFEGTPGDVKIPAVAQQWTAFGEGGKYRLVKAASKREQSQTSLGSAEREQARPLGKDEAVNMRYSQEITAGKTMAGIFQGPQNIIDGEKYVGSIYAKGKGELMVGLRNADGKFVALESLGKVNSKDWKKYEFTLKPKANCDGDFAIAVVDGTVQVDMATMTTQTDLD